MAHSRRLLTTLGLLMLLVLAGLRDTTQAASPVNPPAAPHPAAPETHGRLSELYWSASGPNTATLTAIAGIRRSFYSPPPNIGDSINYAPMYFGDGTQSPTANFIVTYVDVTHDWVLAEKTETHTYSSPGPWIANFNSCCRLSAPQHINNPDQAYRAETLINFNGTSASPISSVPAIVDCPQEGLCNFTVPAYDPDNQPMHFRFATATEAGDPAFHQPGPPQAPNAATINATTGVYSWDTHSATLNSGGETFYSTQVMIENQNCGVAVAKTPVDFFIRLIPATSNHPPRFIAPTPPDGTVYTIQAGHLLTVTIAADDPDAGDNVALSAIGLPSGASFPNPSPNNPVSSTLTWTPTGNQLGTHVINFVATDTAGASVFTSIIIEVTTLAGKPAAPQGACSTPTPGPSPTPPGSVSPTPVVSPTPPAGTITPTPCTISFTDVDPNNPFYAFIRCLACRQIVSGYGDGTFRWGNNITRGQLAKVLAGAANLQDVIPSTQQTFEDVPSASAFWLWTERLTARGAISGYGCGGPGEPCVPPQNRPYFRPGADATRSQIAKITALTAQIPDPVSTSRQTFQDVPSSYPTWLWIEQLAGRGVISGYTCGGPGEPCMPPQNRPYFRPGAATTRGQLSKIAAQTFFPACQTPQR